MTLLRLDYLIYGLGSRADDTPIETDLRKINISTCQQPPLVLGG